MPDPFLDADLGGWFFNPSAKAGGRKSQIFLTSGTFTPAPGVNVVDVLVVGGGGGGGAGVAAGVGGGGGGAGRTVLARGVRVSGAQTVTVGGGGAGGANGTASSFGALVVAAGGGHG
ncbi:MAG: hypothetical protein ACREQ5_11760, partial [Candidatus Dormibacteria bacterium]